MDNERVDYKAAKADGRVTNNHRKACDICMHETADNKASANRTRLSQNLLDKKDYTSLIFLHNFRKRNLVYFFLINHNHEHSSFNRSKFCKKTVYSLRNLITINIIYR